VEIANLNSSLAMQIEVERQT
jgi:hypothetical protein